jgi:surface antigen
MREIVFVVVLALASPAVAQMDGVIDDRPELDPHHRQLFTETLNKAMAHQAGSVSEWNDPASQTHGQVLTGENHERKGSVCRSFDHTVFINEQVWSYSGIACKGADGTWAEDGWLSNGQFVKSTDAPARVVETTATPSRGSPSPPAKVSKSGGATAIPLVSQGGTFLVPVLINGVIELHFTVDSGASDVTIPADVS